MELNKVTLDQDTFSCSICLDLLNDPVTIPCGHSYCMRCIRAHWDGEEGKRIHSCPQCRKKFSPRPALVKNTMLAALVEELTKTGPRAAPPERYAGPQDVACDVCSGRKLKAVKSCLVCLASYCQEHLQPHRDAPPLQKHRLAEPSGNLQEQLSSRQDAVMQILAQALEESAEDRAEKRRQLEAGRQQLRRRLQERERDATLLREEAGAINRSADRAAEDSERTFGELVRLVQKRSSEVKRQIRSQQKAEAERVRRRLEELEREISDLRRRDAELEKLSHAADPARPLQGCPAPLAPEDSAHASAAGARPLRYFEDVTAAVSELREKLQQVLAEKGADISVAVRDADVLLSQQEPKTRADFLKYARQITLDANTANRELVLTEGNRRVTFMKQRQSYSHHPDRFTYWCQALSREGMTGRCYWEVEWGGQAVVVAVSYRSIRRAGSLHECCFGCNDKSCALSCYREGYTVYYNNNFSTIKAPLCFRIGVYLDHRAGVLSFFRVSDSMELLHRVQSAFSQPVHAGLRFFDSAGDSAEFIKLK